ncbi:MAG: hypothetical protein HFH13_04365 [Dorea sp.]|jgi:membrane protein required for beta-lactamase induction|nr:hypothetical protein [Dorea sp.]
MWVIFILVVIVLALVGTLVTALAAWIIHKVSNAIIRDNWKLEKEEKTEQENKK